MRRKARKGGRGPLVLAVTLVAVGLCLVGAVAWMAVEASPAADHSLSQAEQEAYEEKHDGFPKVDWEHWQKANPDVIGWVTIPGTKVDYPIVQAHAQDPDFYLHHDIKGKWSVYGTPYLDAECTEGGLFDSANAVVYAHHMDDGSMFAAVSNYSTDEEFAKKHSRVLVQTPHERKVMRVRFAHVTNASHATKRTAFSDSMDHDEWYVGEMSKSGVVLDRESRPRAVLTLCTCSYNTFKNERTLCYTSEEE